MIFSAQDAIVVGSLGVGVGGARGVQRVLRLLIVSPSAIKSRVSNILSKLGVANRTEAVTLAQRHRIAP